RLAGRLPVRPLDEQVVDRAQLFNRIRAHSPQSPFSDCRPILRTKPHYGQPGPMPPEPPPEGGSPPPAPVPPPSVPPPAPPVSGATSSGAASASGATSSGAASASASGAASSSTPPPLEELDGTDGALGASEHSSKPYAVAASSKFSSAWAARDWAS